MADADVLTHGPVQPGRAGAAVAGIAGPLAYGLVTLGDGWRRPGYDPIRQHISDLGVGAGGWVQNAATLLLGGLLLAFACGLRRGLADDRGPASTPLLIAGCGIGALLVGLVPVDATTAPGARVWAHTLGVGLCILTLLPTVVLLPRVRRHDPRWRVYGRGGALCGGAALALMLGFVIVGPAALRPWSGLVERLLIAVGLCWIEVLAVGLLRAAPAATARGGQAGAFPGQFGPRRTAGAPRRKDTRRIVNVEWEVA